MSEDAAVRAERIRRQHLVGAPHATTHAIIEIARSVSNDDGGGAWGAGASAAVAGRARALLSALARHKMTLED
jgi:t-SNARE complex subunit (syntaxin)